MPRTTIWQVRTVKAGQEEQHQYRRGGARPWARGMLGLLRKSARNDYSATTSRPNGLAAARSSSSSGSRDPVATKKMLMHPDRKDNIVSPPRSPPCARLCR